jgi:RimJ/RimL family protein N-acetyltransferase
VHFVYQLSRAEPTAYFSWPQAARGQSEREFSNAMTHGVFAHFVVVGRRTSTPIGYVVAQDADLENGTVHIGIFLLQAYQAMGLGAEAGGLLLKYLFDQHPIHKIYGMAIDRTSPTRGWNRLFREEACLRDHCWFEGRYWNEYIFAVDRDDWNRLAARFLDRTSRAKRGDAAR